MLAIATADIQAVYESQPLLTQAGGFPSAADDVAAVTEEEKEEDSDATAG